MCVVDWRLGRLVRSEIRRWVSGSSTNLVVQADPTRVGIKFFLRELDTTNPTFIQCSIDGISGFALSEVFPYVQFNVANDGDLPMRAFTLSNASAACSGLIILQTLPLDVLTAGITQFTSEYQPWKR